ncbi:MAG TPA: DinB family protein [Anaerolineales bacterium]|nr:DinB family protein [Anaerolineales bacterium]
MNIKDYLKQVYDYTQWANRRYFAVAEGLSEAQFHRGQGHSWGDVHAMLVHMMSSEWVWLQRWHGTNPKGHLNKDDFPTLASVDERWTTIEAEMRAFIESQTAASLESNITYSNFSGETFRVPLYQMLMHVANHNTHHRGELAAMFALMNVPHPEEEVIQYFLNASGQKRF